MNKLRQRLLRIEGEEVEEGEGETIAATGPFESRADLVNCLKRLVGDSKPAQFFRFLLASTFLIASGMRAVGAITARFLSRFCLTHATAPAARVNFCESRWLPTLALTSFNTSLTASKFSEVL